MVRTATVIEIDEGIHVSPQGLSSQDGFGGLQGRTGSAEDGPAHKGAVSLFEAKSSPRDWPAALQLVERAAGLIHDYEKKFVAIEQDARGFIQRVNDDQARFSRCIASLEQRLSEAEAKATRAEAELQSTKLLVWEARMESKAYQKRLAEAEAELRNSGAYIKRVEDLLGGL